MLHRNIVNLIEGCAKGEMRRGGEVNKRQEET